MSRSSPDAIAPDKCRNKFFRADFSHVRCSRHAHKPLRARDFSRAVRAALSLLTLVGMWEKCASDRYCSRGCREIIFGR